MLGSLGGRSRRRASTRRARPALFSMPAGHLVERAEEGPCDASPSRRSRNRLRPAHPCYPLDLSGVVGRSRRFRLLLEFGWRTRRRPRRSPRSEAHNLGGTNPWLGGPHDVLFSISVLPPLFFGTSNVRCLAS